MSENKPTVALSIRQPWAWFILNLGKDIENRNWLTHFRGSVYIHAALGMTQAEYAEAVKFARKIVGSEVFIPKYDEFDRGGIVGEMDIVGCVTASDSPWFMGKYGFLVRNAVQTAFVPCKGSLSFFKPNI